MRLASGGLRMREEENESEEGAVEDDYGFEIGRASCRERVSPYV